MTFKQIEELLAEIPQPVCTAYDSFLKRSPDYERAKEFPCITLAAMRPLTLQEMNIALNVKHYEESQRNHRGPLSSSKI